MAGKLLRIALIIYQTHYLVLISGQPTDEPTGDPTTHFYPAYYPGYYPSPYPTSYYPAYYPGYHNYPSYEICSEATCDNGDCT